MRRAGDRPRPISWHGVAAVSWLLAALCGSCVSPPAEPAAEPAAKPVVEPVAEPVAAPAPPAAPAPSEPEPTGWSPDQPAEWPAEWLAEQKARKAAQAAKEGQAAPGTETPVAPAAPAVEPQIEPVVKADEEEATAPGFVHGSLSTVFRDRNTGSQRSRDLWALLDVEMGDEETDLWTATVVGRVYETFGEDDGKFSSPEVTLGSNLLA